MTHTHQWQVDAFDGVTETLTCHADDCPRHIKYRTPKQCAECGTTSMSEHADDCRTATR